MTVQDGWDALVQLRDTLGARKRKYDEQRGKLDSYQVFDRGRLAGKAFVAKNARSYLVDTYVSAFDPPDMDRNGDGWEELREFQDFVLENYLRPATPGDIPDFKPGEKGFELGKADEAQDISDDIERVLEFEGPDSDDLAHENVDDPDDDPIITEDGRVLKLGRRDPAGLQDELETMAERDVIDVDAEEIDVEGDIEDMTDENDTSDDSDELELEDELRGVEDPDADNAPDALLDRDEDDGDDGDA